VGIDSIWMYLQQLPFQHREEYTYAHISTNQPTNQPVSPSITPPLSISLSYIFFFFYSIHSFIHCLSLSTTYLPHFSPPPPTHLISLHLSYFSRTHLISPSHTHTHLHISLTHTHLYLPLPFLPPGPFIFHFSLSLFVHITTLSTLPS